MNTTRVKNDSYALLTAEQTKKDTWCKHQYERCRIRTNELFVE
jgi:hypothetical protein